MVNHEKPLTTHQNQPRMSLKGFFTLEVFLKQESYFSTMESDRVDDGEAGMAISAPWTETQRTRLLAVSPNSLLFIKSPFVSFSHIYTDIN